jgi:Uma2 family endonuclease
MHMTAQPAIERLWLHDDQEEGLVGTDWHQYAIVCVFDALQDLARDAELPWHVGNQHTLVARLPNGKVWRPCPDIMVHPQAGRDLREEMNVSVDGPPSLVIEVVSPTTWRYDLDEVQGKPAGYLTIGVEECLLFDPLGTYLDPPCRGWRRRDGLVEEWLPDADGRYVSEALGVSFRPDEAFLRTYDLSGRLVPTRDELSSENAALRAEQQRQAGEIAFLRAELERLRRLDG